MKLEFRLLGDVAVLADGHPLGLGGARQRSVLALLVLQRGRPMATELLADRLWPAEQPLTAVKTIQVYVSRLRHALGPAADRLASSATGYSLAVADDELDAARFERALRRARETLASGAPATALATFEEALALWSGPALGDLAGRQFARREADRLEELRLQALEELFELRIGAGRGRETIAELRRLTGDQPGRERLWRLLMLALYADGRQGEALAAYQAARRYLVDELGLDPSPELQGLEHAILTQAAPQPRARSRLPAADQAIGVSGRAPAGVVGVEPVEHRTRRIVTALRADVVRAPDVGRLDPERLETLGRRVLQIVRRAVERHGGTIDLADGAGVTAIFGLTLTREDDTLRAIRAAFELRGDPSSGDPMGEVGFRIGVATGEVVTGPRDIHGSRVSGVPLNAAAHLATRAAQGEVLLAPETEELVREMTSTERVAFEPANGPTVSTALRLLALAEFEAIAPRMAAPFVDRAVEMNTLLAAFERVVTEGTPGLATVIGAPGVGKSRLVAEALARISKRARVLRSRCLPYGDGITYWPVRELVSAGAGLGQGETRDDALARLATVVGGLDQADLVRRRVASVLGLADEDAPAEEIQWAVRHFCEALAAERPLVLIVDDLQWAEPALVGLLEHVLDLGHGPLLLVTIARPELEEGHADWLARSSHALIRLDALSEADAATLLDHLAPELPPGPLRSRTLAAAEGNPLFVEQFVAYVSDAAHAGGDRLDDRTRADLPIPPTIGILLAARLDRLPDVERRTLERAAVVGRTFWAGALAELLPENDRADLPRRLARLARRDLVRPDRSDFPDDEAYRFRHLLIRDAAYASLPKRERAELHERFAGWLERRPEASRGEYDLILGHHLEQAYRYRIELGDQSADERLLAERALRYIAPAGQGAAERGDPPAAISLLRRAADLSLPGPRRIELLLDLRNAIRDVGEREAAEAVDAQAVALLAEYPDPELALRRRLMDPQSFAYEGTIEQARDAYALYEQTGDRRGMIRALDCAYFTHHFHGEITAAMEACDQATALALGIGRPGLAAEWASDAALLMYDSPVPVPEALDRCAGYLELASDSRRFLGEILCMVGCLEAMDRADDQWRRRFAEAKALVAGLGLPDFEPSYSLWLGEAELVYGEPGRVVDLLVRSCATLDGLVSLGEPSLARWSGLLASMAPLTAQVLLAVGRLEEVERYAFRGRDLANPTDLDAQSRWRIAISKLRSRQVRHAEAVVLAREAVALLAGSEFVVSLTRANQALAAALRAAGDEPAAVVAAQEARRLASSKQDRSALRKIDAFLIS